MKIIVYLLPLIGIVKAFFHNELVKSSKLNSLAKLSSRRSLNMLDIDKSENLVYDKKNNRLYEADLDRNALDGEFFLTDAKTGSKIYLTRVNHYFIEINSMTFNN